MFATKLCIRASLNVQDVELVSRSSRRRPHWVPLFSLKTGNRGYNLRLDGGIRTWCKQHENIDPSSLVSTVSETDVGAVIYSQSGRLYLTNHPK